MKAFKDAVLAPSTAPKLKKGAYPIDPTAVAAAGKSAAVAPVRATVAKAPAKKAPVAKKVVRRAPGQESTGRQEGRPSCRAGQEGPGCEEGRPSCAGQEGREASSLICLSLSSPAWPREASRPKKAGPRRSGESDDMGEPIADRPLTQPHEDRLSPALPAYQEILDAHGAALAAGSMSYLDPLTGFSVLTAAYLAGGQLLQFRMPALPLSDVNLSPPD